MGRGMPDPGNVVPLPDPDEPAALHRTGKSTPHGKLTAILPAVRVPLDTYDGATLLAHEAGLPLNEWVRVLVMERVHGKDELLRLQAEQIARVSGKFSRDDT